MRGEMIEVVEETIWGLKEGEILNAQSELDMVGI